MQCRTQQTTQCNRCPRPLSTDAFFRDDTTQNFYAASFQNASPGRATFTFLEIVGLTSWAAISKTRSSAAWR